MAGESVALEYALIAREQSDYGGTFAYAGVNGPCSLGTTGFGARLVAGGFSPHAEQTIVIRKTILPATPIANRSIQVTACGGAKRCLKIADEGITDGGCFWEIICNDINERA